MNLFHDHAFARERSQIPLEVHGVHDHNFFDLRLGKDGRELSQMLLRREKNNAAARVVQRKCRLLGRQRGVKRDCDGAEQQAGHIGHGPLRPVFAEDGNAISGSNSPGLQRTRRSGDALAKFARGHRQPLRGLAVQHHAIEVVFDRGEENVVQSGNAHRVYRGGGLA